LFLTLLSYSSDEDIENNQSNSINKIMSLGASRVEGIDPCLKVTGITFGKNKKKIIGHLTL
jgi:hypothetical protein